MNFVHLFLICFEPGAVCFSLCKCLKLQHLGQELQERPQASLVPRLHPARISLPIRDPSVYVYLGRH